MLSSVPLESTLSTRFATSGSQPFDCQGRPHARPRVIRAPRTVLPDACRNDWILEPSGSRVYAWPVVCEGDVSQERRLALLLLIGCGGVEDLLQRLADLLPLGKQHIRAIVEDYGDCHCLVNDREANVFGIYL